MDDTCNIYFNTDETNGEGCSKRGKGKRKNNINRTMSTEPCDESGTDAINRQIAYDYMLPSQDNGKTIVDIFCDNQSRNVTGIGFIW